MKDDFVSVEHLLLALIETADSTLKRLFSAYNITKERFCRRCSPSAATSA